MASKRSRATFEADIQAQQSPYVVYGTPLPSLDLHVRDDGSYVPLWKQEVTDDRGRKRLHGAFTGGFSAGYFNTVGSKEGWAPSTFVSSKSDRKKNGPFVPQKAEDFMDEEDIADAEDLRNLGTSDSFAALGSTSKDTSSSGAFMDILRPNEDTIGVKLLRKMGWRDGQGIGPKLRRKVRLDEREHPPDDGQETHLFAPDNSQMISFIRKNDGKGLGYQGEARLADALQITLETGATSRLDFKDDVVVSKAPKPKKQTQGRGGGFGVGILNDNGSDDDDPYHMGPQISYNRVIGGGNKKKRPETGMSIATSGNPLLRSKPVFISKKAATTKSGVAHRRCHDGHFPLEGFVIPVSASIVSTANKHHLPTIPKDWIPARMLTTSTNTAPNSSSAYQSSASLARSSILDPSTRSTLLGETPLPGKSVFDYLTPAARDRLATASKKSNLPPALSEAPPSGYEPTPSQRNSDLASLIPTLEAATATIALGRGIGGWMPYADDPLKRARYRSFLEYRAGLHDGLPQHADDTRTDDWIKEMQEFAHAAQIFKPMTGMMATRFVSSSSTATTTEQAGSAMEADAETLLYTPQTRADPAEEAARLSMYGPLTRSSLQFFPTRLLCKRFNVKAPDHVQADPGNVPAGPASATPASTDAVVAFGGRFQSSGYQTSTKSLELVGKKEMDELKRESGWQGGEVQGQDGAMSVVPEKAVIDPGTNEALEKERPGDAVFRAIFGSDSEEEG
ncbi:hypothetical protein MMC13_004269 [Lambiella insularis]|nr:hypothetical protein [Lambiella insularis]